MSLCKTVGGRIFVAQDEAKMEQLAAVLEPHTTTCGTTAYSGLTDREEEGVWVDGNTGALATPLNWARGEPNNADGSQGI